MYKPQFPPKYITSIEERVSGVAVSLLLRARSGNRTPRNRIRNFYTRSTNVSIYNPPDLQTGSRCASSISFPNLRVPPSIHYPRINSPIYPRYERIISWKIIHERHTHRYNFPCNAPRTRYRATKQVVKKKKENFSTNSRTCSPSFEFRVSTRREQKGGVLPIVNRSLEESRARKIGHDRASRNLESRRGCSVATIVAPEKGTLLNQRKSTKRRGPSSA